MKYIKKYTLCLIAIIILFNDAMSQQTYLLTDASNKWYEYGRFGGYGPYPEQHVHLLYFFNGDTIINGLTYKKLFLDRKDTTYDNPIYLQNSLGHIASFRQDSLKVYFIMKDSTTEKLYCDFDMTVGDTLKYFYNTHNNTITSVTSVPFGMTTRKRYILNNGFSFYEGIGISLGLFHDDGVGYEGGVYLVCFEQTDIIQYVHELSGTPPCALSSSVATEENSPNTISSLPFPNPFSNQLNFHLPDSEQIVISLYDFLGRRILQQTQTDFITINTEQLVEGIYIYELRNDKGIVNTGKVIKQ